RVLIGSGQESLSQTTVNLAACGDFAYSTEEDFLTRGPTPADGSPIISDGDLLSRTGVVCMRNRDLLRFWDLNVDLGLDAVDVLDVETELVAFSTELNDPQGRFTAGDLLTTWGAIMPNRALLIRFQIDGDRGLDAVHFVGARKDIIAFNQFAKAVARSEWIADLGKLTSELQRYNIDIWFSIEGTEQRATTFSVYDGDLLSAVHGTVVVPQNVLLPNSVPAGIPQRGVDFGLDAFTSGRVVNPQEPRPTDGFFSTEILYRGKPSFSDGDILKLGNGIAIPDKTIYAPFEPMADFLGTDALYMRFAEPQPLNPDDYLPLIMRILSGGLQ
ncbi:MAG: hypothetical protein D6775_11440, partial [Caldilineae bacterium]